MYMLRKIFGFSERTTAAGAELETAAEGLAQTVKEINQRLRASFGLDDLDAAANDLPAIAEAATAKGKRSKVTA